ncbi:MAG TPA: hypothetical protein VHX14_18595, partial [Thermoanaerobaculia bacterium]|nr:hypothetical protein [Thermoanaerobaculia bacterium]
GLDGDCQEFAERSAVQSAKGVTRVVIIGRAGFLHVEGRAGAEIRATGHACAAIEELLVGIRLSASRSGSQVTIEAHVPKQESSLFASAPRLDFTVTLPAGIAVDVADTSGDLIIRDTGKTRVAVALDDVNIRDVKGNVTVQARSGAIDIDGVSGDVRVPSNPSGAVRIARVGGSVTIDQHGSGSIEVRNVKRNLAITVDGPGAVAVSDIGGDFTLGSKGSGSVDYERVTGRVTVPVRYRR